MRCLSATLLLLLLAQAECGFRMPWQKKKPAAAEKSAVPDEPALPAISCAEGDSVCATSMQQQSCAADDEDCRWPLSADDITTPPHENELVIDRANLLHPDNRLTLFRNLTKFNTSNQLRCHLAIIPTMPTHNAEGKVLSPRDFAKKLLRDWYGRADKIVLIVLIKSAKRMEVALGSRARRKLKDAQARRVARKVQPKIAEAIDAAAILAVKDIVKQLNADKGFAGSLRSVLMPVVIVLILVFMYFKNQSQRPSFEGGMMGGGMMGGGMPGGGMPGGMGGADMAQLQAMMAGGGMGGMGGRAGRGMPG